MNLAKRIKKRTKLPIKLINQLLKQKHISPGQIQLLTGVAASAIHNMSRKNIKKPSQLTRCYPYPIGLSFESGPIFILNDEKCLEFISRHNP